MVFPELCTIIKTLRFDPSCLLFVPCSYFEVRFTLKRKNDIPSLQIQWYSLVCGCHNHVCLEPDDLGFSFPQRNVPHVVWRNLESRYPVQYIANHFQRLQNEFVFSRSRPWWHLRPVRKCACLCKSFMTSAASFEIEYKKRRRGF